LPFSGKDIGNFINALERLPDPRDKRGKRHLLTFVIPAVTMAILSGRSKVSSIHRYICNRIEWLREVTKIYNATPISRAHLPRLLEQQDWLELNIIIEEHFGMGLDMINDGEWIAIDGKTLRGTVKSGDKQSVIFAVGHKNRVLAAQRRMEGEKSSEIPEVRQLLEDSGLEKKKITLDAHHLNPTTTSQVHQAGGSFIIQAKENQPILLAQCQDLSSNGTEISCLTSTEKGHGRISTRQGTLYSVNDLDLDERWAGSGFETLIVMDRETIEVRTEKTTNETSYYLSNLSVKKSTEETSQELVQAIREHWGVESENWIRDVTFNEDKIKTKSGNQAQIMASLRSLGIRVLRKTKMNNFQAAIEKFIDCPEQFKAVLRQVNFL